MHPIHARQNASGGRRMLYRSSHDFATKLIAVAKLARCPPFTNDLLTN
jgi:hypothetical protein